MSRFHVHLNVTDLASSLHFYRTLFAAEPTVLKPDYAKWMLDDPKVNFAISSTGAAAGIDHLGIQADDADGLAELGRRLDAADGAVLPQPGAICCYARSDKLWTEDPQGVRWENFHTLGETATRDGRSSDGAASACASGETDNTITPASAATSSCCAPRTRHG